MIECLLSIVLSATPQDRYLDAIERIESRGNCNAVGDGGRSLGPYQIQRSYWKDSGVPGRYEQVRDRAYARRVVLAHAKRYEPGALRRGDWETLARLHNSGPSFRRHMRATDGYCRKVNQAMVTR